MFEKETGIRYHEWYGRYWARWGDALLEAGLQPNVLNERAERDSVLQAYLGLVAELGHVPTEGELRLRTRKADGFPGRGAIRAALGTKPEQVQALLDFAIARGSPSSIIELLRGAVATAPAEDETAEDPVEPESEAADGFVYLMKSGKHFKIGRTNTLDRRQYEIGVQLPEKLEPVHSIRTDDPSGIEAYWHNRFKDQRLNGEWFKLSSADVRAFKRRRSFM